MTGSRDPGHAGSRLIQPARRASWAFIALSARIVADVFGELRGAGRWRTARLLDGNIGKGSRPLP